MAYCVDHANQLKANNLCQQLVRLRTWQVARFLLGWILGVYSCLGVTVTDRMVAKTVNTSGGCVVPTAATTFLTTDQSVWLWFNVSDAKAGDVASATANYPRDRKSTRLNSSHLGISYA